MPCPCGEQSVDLMLYLPGLAVVRCPKCGRTETQSVGGIVVGMPLPFPLRINPTEQKILAQPSDKEQVYAAEVADLKIIVAELKKRLEEKGVI